MAEGKTSVLHVVDSLGLAGLEQVVIRLSNGMDKEKFETSICSFKGFSDQRVAELDPAIKLYSFDKFQKNWQLIVNLIRVIKKNKITIVISHNLAPLPIVAIASVLSLCKTVHCEHGRETMNPSYSFFRYWALIIFYKLTNCIVCVSSELQNYLMEKFFVNKKKIYVIHNAVDSKIFSNQIDGHIIRASLGIPSDVVVIGTVARPRHVKNLGFLLGVVKKLVDMGKKILFLQVGAGHDDPGYGGLHSLAEQLGIGSNVIFLGKRTDIPMILPAFDIYLNTSTFEGLSCSILEAMSSGRAIVASNVGGNPEIVVHGETGFLFNLNSEAECIESIARLIDSESLRRLYGNNGRQRVENCFRIEQQTKKFEKLIFSMS